MKTYIETIKSLLGNVRITSYENRLVVAPGGFFSPSKLQMIASDISAALPGLDVYVGQAGVVEGMIVVRF